MAKISNNGGVEDNLSDVDISEQYDCYGRTPPRTRLLRKYKDKKNKDNFSSNPVKPSPKMTKKFGNRRNTVACMFDELINKADNEHEQEGKRSDKRSMKLLRGSERDLKLDIHSAQAAAIESNDLRTPHSRRVASCQRFMSLCSKKISSSTAENIAEVCTSVNGGNGAAGKVNAVPQTSYECSQERVEFYQLFSLLVKMGSGTSNAIEYPPDNRTSRNRRAVKGFTAACVTSPTSKSRTCTVTGDKSME